MVLDFDEIRRIHRLEKNTSRLVEVESDFYNGLSELVSKQEGKGKARCPWIQGNGIPVDNAGILQL